MTFRIFNHVKTDHRLRPTPQLHQYWTRLRSSEFDDFAPPLQIVSCGMEHWVAGRFYERRPSHMYGIELVTAGNAEFTQDGHSYLVQPGELYILRRNVNHLYRTGPAGFYDKQFIAVEGVLLDSLLLATGLAACDCVAPRDSGAVVAIMEEIRHTFTAKAPGFALHLSRIAYQLVLLLARDVALRYPDPVRAAIEHIDRNLNRSLTGLQLARVAGLSQTHFNRLFRRHVGISPKQFHVRHKMEWAEHLLTESELSVKEVAATLGYDDPLYFSSQFRRHTGHSPRHYRRLGGLEHEKHAAPGGGGIARS
jgi:AraC family transcriptional regulator of arabinose operon